MFHGVTRCDRLLHGVTPEAVTQCYRVLYDVTRCYRVLHAVTSWYTRLQGVLQCYTVLQGIFTVLVAFTSNKSIAASVNEPEANRRGSSLIGPRRPLYRGLQHVFAKRKELW